MAILVKEGIVSNNRADNFADNYFRVPETGKIDWLSIWATCVVWSAVWQFIDKLIVLSSF